MAIDITLRRVFAGPADSAPTALAHTDWLYDTPPSALRQLYLEYGVLFDQALAAAIGVLGEPASLLPSESTASPVWYPEAIRLASWSRGEDTFYVALVHHDRESPITVEAGLVSNGAIAERSQ